MAAETTEAVDSSMTEAAGGATVAVAATTAGATASTLPDTLTDTTVAATGGLTDEQGGHGCINN